MKDRFKKTKKGHRTVKAFVHAFFSGVISFKGFCQAGNLVYWAACPHKGPETTLSFILHHPHSALDVAGRQKCFLSLVVGQPPGALRALAVTVSWCSVRKCYSKQQRACTQPDMLLLFGSQCAVFFPHQGFDFVHLPPFPKNLLEQVCKLWLDILKAYSFFTTACLCTLHTFLI